MACGSTCSEDQQEGRELTVVVTGEGEFVFIISFQIDQIRKTLQAGGVLMGPNNRPLQKSNNRACVLFKLNQQY